MMYLSLDGIMKQSLRRLYHNIPNTFAFKLCLYQNVLTYDKMFLTYNMLNNHQLLKHLMLYEKVSLNTKALFRNTVQQKKRH